MDVMDGVALRTVEENNTSEITLWGYGITDRGLLPIVEAIREKMRGLQLIEHLSLSANSVGNTGSQALATLLEDPIYCKLHTLQLQGNQIDNDGVSFLINSLANNTKLKVLWLHNNPIDRSLIEGIFCKLLCNTSSVNSIYLSNHTLEDISLPKTLQNINSQLHMAEIPGEMGSLLQLNKDSNKSNVAVRKILRYHPNIDMGPLFTFGLKDDDKNTKALPYVINWFDKASAAIDYVGSDSDEEERYDYQVGENRLSAIFQFVLAMPLLFVPVAHTKASDKKRKRIK